LPSKDELWEMNTIGQDGPEGNSGDLHSSWYWSSSDNEYGNPWSVNLVLGGVGGASHNASYYVRVIRAFGNWTMGCMDSLACNFNLEANMADGSCTYPDLGYDCNGNIDVQVGDEAFGGIVFYVDETGQHGLVAATEDLTEGATDPMEFGYNGYEWGCDWQEVNGADGTSIGTGYQNTIDIVNQGCSTLNGGITAAQAALDAEINGYSDWYLPSRDELVEMYNTIVNGGLEGNIGGFDTSDWPYYWSSSEYFDFYAWDIYSSNGNAGYNPRYSTYRVRVIRSF